jgi:hypothetical protein
MAAPTLQVEIPTAATAPTLQVEIPTAAMVASSLNQFVGDEGLQIDLDTVVGVTSSSLDLMAARILPLAVAATREVHQLREILTHCIEGV